jgi:hypothetical protein
MAININFLISLILNLFLISNLFSQTNQQSDNEDIDMFESIRLSLKTKPKLYVTVDNKNSFISNRRGLFLGFKVGLEYQEMFRYGLGFNTLFNKTYSTYINEIKKSTEDLNFNYLSIFAEYIFYKDNPKYEFSLPIDLGFGYSWLSDRISTTGYFQMLYEAQLNGMYFPFRFFGIGAGFGYRLMLINNPYIDENFTAPIYNFKLKLILGKLFNND